LFLQALLLLTESKHQLLTLALHFNHHHPQRCQRVFLAAHAKRLEAFR